MSRFTAFPRLLDINDNLLTGVRHRSSGLDAVLPMNGHLLSPKFIKMNVGESWRKLVNVDENTSGARLGERE